MKLKEILHPNTVTVDLKSTDKGSMLAELVDLLVSSGSIKESERKQILSKLKDREAIGSTGIGKGVGIPHAKCPAVKKMVAAFGVSKKGVDFNSLDGEPTYIFFLLVAPGEIPGPHLKALAKISRILDDKFVRDKLRSAKTKQDILDILEKEEQKGAVQ